MSDLNIPKEVENKIIEIKVRLRSIFEGAGENEVPNPIWMDVKI